MTNPHQDLEDQIGIQKQVLEYKLKNQARRRAEARALITKGQAILDELDQKVASNQASIERMTQELGKRQAMTLGPWEEDTPHLEVRVVVDTPTVLTISPKTDVTGLTIGFGYVLWVVMNAFGLLLFITITIKKSNTTHQGIIQMRH